MAVLNHTNEFVLLKERSFISVDAQKNVKLSGSSSDNLPVIVGGTVGACVIIIIGVVVVLFAMRYVS